jgi:hypothetical protein
VSTATVTAPSATTAAPKARKAAKAANPAKSHHGTDRLPPGRGGKTEKHVFSPRTTILQGKKGECPAPREGSKRAALLELLVDKGATITQMEKKFEWTPRDCMDALRLLSRLNGYTVEVKENVWHAKKK